MNDSATLTGAAELETLILNEPQQEIRLRSALRKLDAADYVKGNGLFRGYASAVMEATLFLAQQYQRAKAENEKERRITHDLEGYVDRIHSITETFVQYIEREPSKTDGFFVAVHLRGEVLPRIDHDSRIQEAVVRIYSASDRPVFAALAAREYRLDALSQKLREDKKFALIGEALDLHHDLKQ